MTAIREIPRWVWALAVFAALLHLVPLWYGQIQTPPGWAYTGVTDPSPDTMQYRSWMRQSQETGLFVRDQMTPEPTPPFIPVLFYWGVGVLATSIGMAPEFVYAYVGALLALSLVVLVFAASRLLVRDERQRMIAVGAIVLGGGSGALQRVVGRVARAFDLTSWTPSVRPIEADWRGTHVVTSLFDSHSLLVWSCLLAAVLVGYAVVHRTTPGRVAALASVSAFLTVIHVYSGVTLVGILSGVLIVCALAGEDTRGAFYAAITSGIVVGVTGGSLFWIYHASGVRFSTIPWVVTPVELFFAHPLAWATLALGLIGYVTGAGLHERFLIGWILGCTLLTLSGDLYEFAGRSVISLSVPLYLAATTIACRRFARVPTRLARTAVVVALLVLAGTLPATIADQLRATSFAPDKPWIFQSSAHRAILEAMLAEAGPDDLLFVPELKEERRHDYLWLAPEFPGRLYCCHAFLTQNLEERRRAARSLPATAERFARFLDREGIGLVFLPAGARSTPLERTTGLVRLAGNAVGALYRFDRRDGN